jgi:hypothetical protein
VLNHLVIWSFIFVWSGARGSVGVAHGSIGSACGTEPRGTEMRWVRGGGRALARLLGRLGPDDGSLVHHLVPMSTVTSRPTLLPCFLLPAPPPSMSIASCYALRRPATGERPCLLRPSPLPLALLPPPPCSSRAPMSAPAFSDPVPHKMTEEITKWLSKSQND